MKIVPCVCCGADNDKVHCTSCGHDQRMILGSTCCHCDACEGDRAQRSAVRVIETPDGAATFSYGHLTAG